MDKPMQIVVDDIVGSAVAVDGSMMLVTLTAGGRAIDLTFPRAKADELVSVLTEAVMTAARNRGEGWSPPPAASAFSGAA